MAAKASVGGRIWGSAVSVWAGLGKWDRLGVFAGAGLLVSAGVMAVG